MSSNLIWIAVLGGLLVALKLLRPVLGFVLGPQIAAKAMAAQPDLIHLEPAPESAWSNVAARDRLTRETVALGFTEAGSYTVRELPAFKIRLFAHGPESLYAVVYEHPKRGTWLEFACRFTDGNGCTWSSLPPTGLNPRPGHPVHNMPNSSPASLWRAVMRERPAKPTQPAAVSSAVGDFERVWAESMAWRKQNGITRLEVASVGARKAA
jgi:hypothetical protein